MKRFVFVLLILSLALSALSAEKSIYDVISEFPEDRVDEMLASGIIDFGSPYGEDVPSIAFDGTKGKEKAEEDDEADGCFIMGVASFVPYPDDWADLNHDEKKLRIINTLLSISTIKGITYLSHTAGDEPRVLFSDAYTLTSANKGKKAYDVEFTSAPEEYEYSIAAYLKDNIFGGNVYLIDYDITEDEIFVTFTNKDKLKFLFFTAVEAEELNMCVDCLMTKEGMALFALATIYREDTSIDTPFVSVHLPSAFNKRIISLRNWFVKEIDK